MFELKFIERASLPRLAWLAHIRREEHVVQVTHGEWVETRENFFVEGAWDGDFKKGGFITAGSFYGSGARVSKSGTLIIATSTHPRERLWMFRHRKELFISNSLVFVLRKTGKALDEDYNQYQDDIRSISLGIKNYIRHIPLKTGEYIKIFYVCNVEIARDFSLTETSKKPPGRFSDFNEYQAYLIETIQRIFRNGQDKNRKVQYQPLATISRGFDSTCCAVLAQKNGCDSAITIISGTDSSDSGIPIATQLGMKITEVQEMRYLKSERAFIEAEVLSTGFGTSGLYFLSFEPYLESRLVITGYHGDKVWQKQPEYINDELMNDCSGAGYAEFRLRVGFIQFVVPHIGATGLPDIYKISNSEAMKKWSAGETAYDRPIPTKINEEAGIKRTLYGQKKQYHAILPDATIGNRILQISWVKHFVYLLGLHRWKIARKHHLRSFSTIIKRESFLDLQMLWLNSRNSSLSSLAFIWGVKKTVRNYPLSH